MNDAAWESINTQYGPCPECGGKYVGGDSRWLEDIKQNPPWWGVPSAAPDNLAWIVGHVMELTLICEQGHRKTWKQTQFYERPYEPMFP